MAPAPHLRERIMRALDTLNDEKAYQVLDYVEFVTARHGQPSAPASLLARFTEGVEDTMRAGRLPTTAIIETMGLLNKAVGVLNGVAAAGKSVASDIVSTASDMAKAATTSPPASPTAPEIKPEEPPQIGEQGTR